MKTITKKSMKITTKGKSNISKGAIYIPKDFDFIKSCVKDFTRKDFNKIVTACKEHPQQDIRLSQKDTDAMKMLGLIYKGIFKGLKGKVVSVLSITKGLLYTANASVRKLMTCFDLLTGNDRVDVVEYYYGTKDCKHPRKALKLRIKK